MSCKSVSEVLKSNFLLDFTCVTTFDNEVSCLVESFSTVLVFGRFFMSLDCFLCVGVKECFGLDDSLLLLLLLIMWPGFEATRLTGLGLKLKTLFDGVLVSFNGRRIKLLEAGVLGIEAFVDEGFLWFSDEGFENFGEFLPSL